jgi:general secretion pathway protein D
MLGCSPSWLVRILTMLGALCVCLAGSPAVRANDQTSLAPPSAALATALETRGDLSLQDASMEKALFTIGSSWGVNIVVGKDVVGNVGCVYQQAPLREVLDAILLANGYSYRAVGESIVVQRVAEVGSANPLFQSAAIPITHSDLNEIVEAARLLASSQGQVRALESARSILVVDFADRVASIREFVAQMDAAASSSDGISAPNYKSLQVAYFHTQYIPVNNAKEPISALLSQVGRVSTMPDENRLVVIDYASNVDMVRRVLEKIDQPRPQVRITALIYDISLADVEQLGLNWFSDAKGNNVDDEGVAQQALTFDTQTLAPFQAGSAGGTFTVRSLTRNFDLNTVGLFLQNAKDSRLLADPNVTVVENELAVWKSVSEIPFQQITQSELGGQIGTTAFKEVGITLQVRARIASDATIEMLVQPEFGRVVGFTENENQPIIDTRSASTIVRIANRQTLVIGGLRQRSDTGEFNGIPFLKDVRYIGPIFRSRDTNVRESELIVFIMPEIVSYDEPAQSREYMAQETIACRLARVPVAEGCGNGCESSPVTDRLMPPNMSGDSYLETLPPVSTGGSTTWIEEKVPLRSNIDDRYRAKPGFGEKAKQPQTANAKTSMWNRLFR